MNNLTPEIKCGKCSEEFTTPAALEAHYLIEVVDDTFHRSCMTPSNEKWILKQLNCGVWYILQPPFVIDTENKYREQRAEHPDWSYLPGRPFIPWDSCGVFA